MFASLSTLLVLRKVQKFVWRWKRTCLALVALLVLIALAPRILSFPPLLNWIANRAARDLNGSVQIESASLGWLSRPVFKNVEIRDTEDKTVFTAKQVEGDRRLIFLLLDRNDLGHFRCEKPTVHVVSSRGATNIESLLEKYLNAPDDPNADKTRGIGLSLEVVDADVHIIDRDNKKEWHLHPVQLTLQLPHDRRKEIALKLNGLIADDQRPGSLDADLKMHLLDEDGKNISPHGKLELNAKAVPLEPVALVLRRLEPGTDVRGWVDARVNGEFAVGSGLFAEAEVALTGERLDVHGPWLRGDRLYLNQLKLEGGVALRANKLTAENLRVQSDVGRADFTGSVDLHNPTALLGQSGVVANVDVDLPQLAQRLPHTLHLQQDLKITSGKLNVRVASRTAQGQVSWDIKVGTVDLRGERKGQVLTWQEPFTLSVAARQDAQGLPIVDKLSCKSDFINAEGSGSLDNLTVKAEYSLDRLTEQVSRFIDLGSYAPSGKGTATITVNRNSQGIFTLHGDIDLRQLGFGKGTGATTFDVVKLTIDATGSKNDAGAIRVESGKLRLESGREEVGVQLLQPIADLNAGLPESLQLTVKGEAARVRLLLKPIFELPTEWKLTGPLELTGVVRLKSENLELENAHLTARNFTFAGLGLMIQEPTLDVQTNLGIKTQTGQLNFRSLRVVCPTLTAQFPTLVVQTEPTLQLDGTGNLEGKLAGLERWLFAPLPTEPSTFGGAVSGKVIFKPGSPALGIVADLQVVGFTLGDPRSPTWSESKVKIDGTAAWNGDTDTMQIDKLRLETAGLTCDASGKLARLSETADLSLAGNLDYDLTKMEPQLRGYLGETFRISGRDRRPIHIEGPLSAPTPTKPVSVQVGALKAPTPGVLSRLTGGTGMSWQSVQAFGCKVGPTDFKVQLSKGWLVASPIVASFNQGRLNVQPNLYLDPGPMAVNVAQGTIVERSRITPELCATALGYALPVLADVAEADGEITVALDKPAWIPLSDPKKSTAEGKVTIHTAKLVGGPLVQELGTLMKSPTGVALTQEQVIPVQILQGRVHHQNLEMRLGDTVIRTQGSVGFDGSMALIADMPIPAKYLPPGKAGEVLAKQRIRVPIGGTIHRPRLDTQELDRVVKESAKNMASDVLRTEVEDRLKGLFPKK